MSSIPNILAFVGIKLAITIMTNETKILSTIIICITIYMIKYKI